MGNSILTAHSNSHATSCTERALTIKMNADRAMDEPKLDTNPYNFAVLAPFLHVTNFH